MVPLPLEERLHQLRGTGRDIKSLSAVVRDVLERGLRQIEMEGTAGKGRDRNAAAA